MLERQHSSHSKARTKQWYFFMLLSVAALAYVSCSDTAHHTSREAIVQPPPIMKQGRMPLTDSPPQDVITPTVPISTPSNTLFTIIPKLPLPSLTATPLAVPAGYEAKHHRIQ
jgi:hypothetical protein